MSRRAVAGAVLALALGACAPSLAGLPGSPVAADGGIAIEALPVALNPQVPAQDRIGAFRYAGGLALTSSDTTRLHGLSDFEISADGRLTAVTDEGDLLTARIVLDGSGRLTGVTGGAIAALPGPDGKPLPGKLEADAEGLALLPSGGKLVSFEQRHRIWLYPADGTPPLEAPAPIDGLEPNGGLEALAPDPARGPLAYVTGGEETGQTWICKIGDACAASLLVPKPAEFGLVAIARLPDGNTAYLLRAWDAIRGSRVSLTILGPTGLEVDRMDLARPLTVDNFEGLAAVPTRDGQRFYLISDDNFQSVQRTLLLAFDWRPDKGNAKP